MKSLKNLKAKLSNNNNNKKKQLKGILDDESDPSISVKKELSRPETEAESETFFSSEHTEEDDRKEKTGKKWKATEEEIVIQQCRV